MKELTMNEISHVFGGGSYHNCTDEGCADASQCVKKERYGSDSGFTKDNTERVIGDATTIGSIIGSGVGSAAGPVGSIFGGLYGAALGYAIDNNLPVFDAEAYGEYIRDVQVW
ncbi:hypothetical protein [Glaesserella sp.]|uniref:hypothetical protein n=1 Tax=Glaesserella sp. TaxID=2094731 RepID=UPI0035A1B91E